MQCQVCGNPPEWCSCPVPIAAPPVSPYGFAAPADNPYEFAAPPIMPNESAPPAVNPYGSATQPATAPDGPDYRPHAPGATGSAEPTPQSWGVPSYTSPQAQPQGTGAQWWPAPAPPRGSRRRTVGIIAGVVGAVLGGLAIIGAVVGRQDSARGPVHANAGAAVSVPGGSNTPAGFTEFRSAADRFSIAVPDGWRSVDITSPGAQAAITQIEQSNPKLGSAFGQSALSMAESGMVLMAINPVPEGNFAANVNVVAHPAPTFSDSDLSQIRSSLATTYSKLGAKVTGTSYLTLDNHRALRETDIISLNLPDGTTVRVNQTQYFLGANGFVFEITLTGDDPNLNTIPNSFATY